METDFLNKEFLHTNGIGGYCSSSLCGANTRRYHGLLVASLYPPVDRRVLVSKIDEEIIVSADEKYLLGTNQYPNVIYPQGHQFLTEYEVFPFPKFTFQNQNFTLIKSVFLKPKSNTVFVEYENKSPTSINLVLKPLFVYRDYHQLFYEDAYFDFYKENINETQNIVYPHFNSIPVYQSINRGSFIDHREWIKNVEYKIDEERGQGFCEDYYAIGSWNINLEPKDKVVICFSTEKDSLNFNSDTSKNEILSEFKNLRLKENSPFYNDLLVSGNQFIVDRASTKSKTILAGYHWFTDWGRDTMIAMRGLTIATENQQASKSILQTFFQSINHGMIPNRFPDNVSDEPEYNTADATLWMFIVLYEYYIKFKDLKFIHEHFSLIKSIIESHINGTRYNIKVNDDGMLFAGQDGVQITWMDAKVGDHVITPRIGYCIELNMLWYNALQIYSIFSKELKDKSFNTTEFEKKFETNFHSYFWNEHDYLNDFVNENKIADASIRPNQVYAVSLPFTVLTNKQEKLVVETIKNCLLTDFGLRSLAPQDKYFSGEYAGNGEQRDSVYHQGTVWSYLLPEFCIASLKANKNSKKSITEVKKIIKPLKEHFYNDNGINGISEIFDGNNPKSGKGCINQAWSVGMMILLLTILKNIPSEK